MRRIFLTVIILCGCLLEGSAQDYRTAIGFRAGLGTGFTVRHFISSEAALEALAQFRYNGVEFTGLYEVNVSDAFSVDGLNWYYGGGAHIGFYDEGHPRRDNNASSANFMTLGLDGIIGIEYVIKEAPIVISTDWKPNFDLIGGTGFTGDSGALSIRYYF